MTENVIPATQPDTTVGGGFATEDPVYSAPEEHRSHQSASVANTDRTGSGAYTDQYTPNVAVDLTDSGDLVEAVAHGFVDEDQVVFSDIVDTTGLTAGTVYYVVNANEDDFQVEEAVGDGAVVLTTDGTAFVHLYDQDETTGVISHTNPDTSTAGVYGLDVTDPVTVDDPAYAAPPDQVVDATQPDTTIGGGSPIHHADPEYRAPAGPVAVTIAETALAPGASYSGHPERAVTFTDAGDLVGLVDHGFLPGDAVVFDDIVTTTGLTEGVRYDVRTAGLTDDAFTVSLGGADGSIVTLTTNGTGTVQRATTSTDVSGNEDMTQVGAVEDESAPGYDVPVAPTAVTATALDNGEVRVEWTAPAQITGAPRIGYYVESSLGMSLYVAGNATSVDIQAWRIEADNQQDQTFTVRAVNKNGSGPKSTASDPVDVVNINQGYGALDFPGVDVNPVYEVEGTVADGTGGAPEAPENIVATPGDGQITVEWDAASGSPTGYRVNVYLDADDSFVDSVDVGVVLTADVTGLDNATAFYAKVIALDDVENSPESDASNTVTTLAVPTAPTGVAGSILDSSSSISWTPGVGGGAATSFEVFVAESATPLVPVFEGDDAASPLLVLALDNGTEYVAKVRGENASGFGPYSTLSAGFTPST